MLPLFAVIAIGFIRNAALYAFFMRAMSSTYGLLMTRLSTMSPSNEGSMQDLLFIALIVVLYASTHGLVVALARLGRIE